MGGVDLPERSREDGVQTNPWVARPIPCWRPGYGYDSNTELLRYDKYNCMRSKDGHTGARTLGAEPRRAHTVPGGLVGCQGGAQSADVLRSRLTRAKPG